jgi:hypothetical protein
MLKLRSHNITGWIAGFSSAVTILGAGDLLLLFADWRGTFFFDTDRSLAQGW